MDVTIEQLIRQVTQEVLRQLAGQGVMVAQGNTSHAAGAGHTAERIDMSKYKTPLVTEQALLRLHESTQEIVVPAGTILTPRARELVRKKNIRILAE